MRGNHQDKVRPLGGYNGDLTIRRYEGEMGGLPVPGDKVQWRGQYPDVCDFLQGRGFIVGILVWRLHPARSRELPRRSVGSPWQRYTENIHPDLTLLPLNSCLRWPVVKPHGKPDGSFPGRRAGRRRVERGSGAANGKHRTWPWGPW